MLKARVILCALLTASAVVTSIFAPAPLLPWAFLVLAVWVMQSGESGQ